MDPIINQSTTPITTSGSQHTQQRLEYIDTMKGLCIICIALLHFEDGFFPDWLNRFIGAFMITGFYVTSGWMHGLCNNIKDTEISVFIKKRFKSLGIPYLWFTLIILIFDIIYVLIGHIDSHTLVRDIYKSIVLNGIGTLWFLPALFFGELLFITTAKYKWHIWFSIIGIILLLLMITYPIPINKMSEPYSSLVNAPYTVIRNSVMAWLIISFTYLFVRKGKLRMNLRNIPTYFIPLGIVLSIGVFIFAHLCSEISGISSLLSSLLYLFTFWLEPLGILLFLAGLGTFKNIISDYLNYWGRNSLILMVTHYSILMELCIYLNKILFHEATLSGWNSIIFFFITMLLEYPIACLINNKYKFLLGK